MSCWMSLPITGEDCPGTHEEALEALKAMVRGSSKPHSKQKDGDRNEVMILILDEVNRLGTGDQSILSDIFTLPQVKSYR